jgi:hypothetical protein
MTVMGTIFAKVNPVLRGTLVNVGLNAFAILGKENAAFTKPIKRCK